MSEVSESIGRKRRVVIVGGGLAGLSAAETLARDCGDLFDVTLLEAKRFTGGRAGSFTDAALGETVDYCQHVAMGCCTNFLSFLERCGLRDSLRRYQTLEFRHPDFPPSRFAASKFLPPPLHLAGSVGRLSYLSAVQKRKIRRAMLRLMRTSTQSLEGQTAGQWLSQQDQDQQAISLFWDVVLVSALGEQTQNVSMAAARKVLMDGFAAARKASDVLVPKQPLLDIFGRSLPEQIRQLGVRVLTGMTVDRLQSARVDQHNAERSAVLVKTRCEQHYPADHVISAVPWHAVGSITRDFDCESLPAFDSIPSSPITGMHLWFDREITDRPHAVMVGTLTQWIFRQPFAQSNEQSHYYQVVISASGRHREMSKQSLVEQVFAEVRKEFPQARNAELLRSKVVTDPNSVFSLSPEVQRLRPSARTSLPWFHLAGDWVDTGWPATMEGAIISGRMAAESVRRSEGRPGTVIDSGLKKGWLAKLMIVR